MCNTDVRFLYYVHVGAKANGTSLKNAWWKKSVC